MPDSKTGLLDPVLTHALAGAPRAARAGLRLSAFALFCLALALVSAAPGAAQTFRGTILGTVTDPNGAVVPNATVTAKNVGTGLERTVTTDGEGNYTIAELPIGTYQVKVSAPNFQTEIANNIAVEVAGERRVDVQLRVGGLA